MSYSNPLLVPPSGAPERLDRVPLTGPESKAAYGEAWLQDLLYRYPEALPIEELDPSLTGLVPVCRELPTRAGPVDVVYLTRDGRPVLVEAKLWRNPEARRKVIGQILDYAKELAAWTAADFEVAVRRARQQAGESPARGLLEVLGLAEDGPEAARFHDALSKSLRRGELLLIIAGDGIREGVKSITDFLEGHGTLHFTFGLVEIAIFRTPGGGHLVQPRVLVQSDIVKRIVVDLRQGQANDEDVVEPEEPEAPGESERARALNAFWTSYLADLRLDRSDQPIGTPARGGNQFFRMPTGRNGWISAYVARSTDTAGVYLALRAGAIGDRLYEALLKDRAAVERELGIPVEWERDKDKTWIITRAQFPGPLLEVSADEVRRRLADWTNRYVSTFRPRLEALARELE